MTEDLSHPSTHPPLPPTTEDDRISWLRLLRSRRVGPSTFFRLMSEHGTAKAALVALPEVARAAGVKAYEPCPEGVVLAEIKAAKDAGARLICAGTAEYPANLSQISDAPPLFWAIGDTAMLSRPMIALVGARNASSLGLRMARALAKDLGERGYVIVSGLARGIDTASHQAALETGTVAVMGGGVDVMYPAENTALAQEIAQSGLRLSEQPMGLTPQARHFPRRNRIISGMSLATIVVEAAAKSGSLITARNALDQGREVLAVPGHPFDARAAGCNLLIRDGARLVRNADDVIEALPPRDAAHVQAEFPLDPPDEPDTATATTGQVADLHNQILHRLGPSPLAEDQLIRDLALAAHNVSPVLTDLELEGRIKRQPGGLLALVD